MSNGRAEVILGRGSFLESFPLFGFELNRYEELFNEKLDLFAAVLAEQPVTWSGTTRPPLENRMTVRRPLNIWTDNPAAALDYEIAQEKASTLGRLGRALEAALAALRDFDAAAARAFAGHAARAARAGRGRPATRSGCSWCSARRSACATRGN